MEPLQSFFTQVGRLNTNFERFLSPRISKSCACDIKHSIGINFKCNLDFLFATETFRNIFQFEFSNLMIVRCTVFLALQDIDRYFGLVISNCSVYSFCLNGYDWAFLNKYVISLYSFSIFSGYHFVCSKWLRYHITYDHWFDSLWFRILNMSLVCWSVVIILDELVWKLSSHHSSTISDTFVCVDRFIKIFNLKIVLEPLLNPRNTRRPAHNYDIIDFFLLHACFFQCCFQWYQQSWENFLGFIFELIACDF